MQASDASGSPSCEQIFFFCDEVIKSQHPHEPENRSARGTHSFSISLILSTMVLMLAGLYRVELRFELVRCEEGRVGGAASNAPSAAGVERARRRVRVF